MFESVLGFVVVMTLVLLLSLALNTMAPDVAYLDRLAERERSAGHDRF